MTPLIKRTMSYMADAGVDPVELHWFDATGCIKDKTEQDQNPLHMMRPPFEKCMVCFEGLSTNQERMEMFMTVVGSDPEDGIALSVWRGRAGQRPIASPILVYAVDGGQVLYGPADDNEKIDAAEAQMILAFMSSWLMSLSQKTDAYQPVVTPSFTNRRKIAAGKVPTYDWHTVTIEPTAPKSGHQGGTHASPRLHDRRGHLRRLRSGKNVWVSPCKVGDASKGTVFKDYRIATHKEGA